jgi:hypothetical protein
VLVVRPSMIQAPLAMNTKPTPAKIQAWGISLTHDKPIQSERACDRPRHGEFTYSFLRRVAGAFWDCSGALAR